ncbi:DUF7345 domain-containing protein [Natronorubrum thiooxidans]|uniref:DUF7345 domain-containing protein n=1 Tax=Natronorubrum thiooxidans TaxID=308853 RepID=A0A1N7E2V1_9EURY|nr:hypothetical protein [Natronorubrum thiooxidans]SIR82371.1 hypothetical protein SAMN05421752_103157 [Natronorubrum thiooxidans]
MIRRRTHSLVLVTAVLLLAAGVVPPVAAADDAVADDRSAFVVELESNGDATVSLALTYDLDDGTDEEAFEQLRANSTDVVDRFDERLSRIANRTASETDREMTVSDVNAAVTTTDGVGVIRLSASWSNLAAVDGDRLVVSEPFASEFQTDRPFVLATPDGYVVSETAIPTDGDGTSTAEWDTGTDLSGFSATVSPSDEAADVDTAETDADTASEALPTPLVPTLTAVLVSLFGYGIWQRL